MIFCCKPPFQTNDNLSFNASSNQSSDSRWLCWVIVVSYLVSYNRAGSNRVDVRNFNLRAEKLETSINHRSPYQPRNVGSFVTHFRQYANAAWKNHTVLAPSWVPMVGMGKECFHPMSPIELGNYIRSICIERNSNRILNEHEFNTF